MRPLLGRAGVAAARRLGRDDGGDDAAVGRPTVALYAQHAHGARPGVGRVQGRLPADVVAAGVLARRPVRARPRAARRRLAWDGAGHWLGRATLLAGAVRAHAAQGRLLVRQSTQPARLLLGRWRDGVGGALRMGSAHGAWCLAMLRPDGVAVRARRDEHRGDGVRRGADRVRRRLAAVTKRPAITARPRRRMPGDDVERARLMRERTRCDRRSPDGARRRDDRVHVNAHPRRLSEPPGSPIAIDASWSSAPPQNGQLARSPTRSANQRSQTAQATDPRHADLLSPERAAWQAARRSGPSCIEQCIGHACGSASPARATSARRRDRDRAGDRGQR